MLLGRLATQPRAFYAHQLLLTLTEAPVLVGGSVRDLLLDLPVHDLDYIVNEGGGEVARQLADALGAAYYPLDEDRDVGRVLWQIPEDEGLIIDVAGLGQKRIADDLAARDFTINAIAMLPTGEPYDPLQGMQDLKARRLRPCRPDSMIADPLRVLRAIRFILKYDLQPVSELDRLLPRAAPYLSQVSVERQRDEVLNLLQLPNPAAALEQMAAFASLPHVFPALHALQGVPDSHHQVFEDVYHHALAVSQCMARLDGLLRNQLAAADKLEAVILGGLGPWRSQLQRYLNQTYVRGRPKWIWLRLAASARDWGMVTLAANSDSRLETPAQHLSANLAGLWLQHYHCAGAEVHFVRLLCQEQARLRTLVTTQPVVAVRELFRYQRDLGESALGVMLLALADAMAFSQAVSSQETLVTYLSVSEMILSYLFEESNQRTLPVPLLNGNDLMTRFHLPSGPQIGRLLATLQEAQAVGDVTDIEGALAFIAAQISSPELRDNGT